MSLAKIKSEFESLVKELELAYYESLALGRPSRISECYSRHSILFEEETLRRVLVYLDEKSENLRDWRLLSRELVLLYAENQVKEFTDISLDLEASSKISFDGKTLAYRMLIKFLKEEKDRETRKKAMEASLKVVRKLNELHEKSRKKKKEVFEELGFYDIVSVWEKLRYFERQRMNALVRKFLRETEDIYRDLWAEYLEKAGLDPSDPRLYDVYRVFRAEKYDEAFPAKEMLPRLVRGIRGLGIDLLSLRNLTLDVEPREKKAPRAFCASPDIPNDVRVSVKPMGGFDDYSALFHEVGHALHFAFTREVEPAFKYAGDTAVSECFAFLMEFLLGEEDFVRNWFPRRDLLRDYLRFHLFYQKLYFVRRYCGKYLFELEYHGKGADPLDTFAKYSREASRVIVEGWEREFYRSFDEEFYTTQYLRAWFGEAALVRYLKENYGERWWTRKAAGDFLKELWSMGQKYTLDEILERLGIGLDPKYLIEEVKQQLG